MIRKRHAFFQLPEFVFMLIRTFMTALSREYVNAEYWHNTIVVDTGTFSSVDFNLTPQDKQKLFDAGYQAAMQFIPQKLGNLVVMD